MQWFYWLRIKWHYRKIKPSVNRLWLSDPWWKKQVAKDHMGYKIRDDNEEELVAQFLSERPYTDPSNYPSKTWNSRWTEEPDPLIEN